MQRAACILLVALAACLHTAAAQRVAPWEELGNTIRAAFDADPMVLVSGVETAVNYTIVITVRPCCSWTGASAGRCIQNCANARSKSKAISTMVSIAVQQAAAGFGKPTKTETLQNGTLVVPGSLPQEGKPVASMLQKALIGNGYFRLMTEKTLASGKTGYFFRFSPMIAQFVTNAGGEWGGFTSLTVANAMRRTFLLNQYQSIFPTSNPCNGQVCQLPIM